MKEYEGRNAEGQLLHSEESEERIEEKKRTRRPTPSPPGEREGRLYYYSGLNPSPTLVALCSTFVWKEMSGRADRPMKRQLKRFGVASLGS